MIRDNLAAIHRRIEKACAAAGRSPKDVRLIAVSKTMPVEAVREAVEAGQRDLGENKVQEAAVKIEAVGREMLIWHLIGHLQSNKAGRAVELFDLIHSVDSEPLAQEVNRRAESRGKRQRILLQVNCSGEQAKSGCRPEELSGLVSAAAALPNLEIEGLMTIGPLDPDPGSARPAFRLLRELRDGARDTSGLELIHLSMGMTADLEVAIEEGATLVRVGTAIFGERTRA